MKKTACMAPWRWALVLACSLSLSGCAWLFGDSPETAPPAPEQNQTSEAPAPPVPAEPPATGVVKQPVKEPAKPPVAEPAKPAAPVPAAEPQVVTMPTAKGDLLFASVNDLLAASAKAEKEGRFLGDIEPFDAFPFLQGADTVGRAFKAGTRGELTVKYFAFHVAGKNYDRRVYGYLVDAGNGKVFGHFDTDADGTFDAHTLEPSLRFDLYEKLKPGQ